MKTNRRRTTSQTSRLTTTSFRTTPLKTIQSQTASDEEIDAAAAIPLDNNIIENEEPQPAAADPRPPANDQELLQDDVPQGEV